MNYETIINNWQKSTDIGEKVELYGHPQIAQTNSMPFSHQLRTVNLNRFFFGDSFVLIIGDGSCLDGGHRWTKMFNKLKGFLTSFLVQWWALRMRNG